MIFSYDGFKGLLEKIISHQYIFLRFNECLKDSHKKAIYLRHDVDISPLAAVQLGRIENALGIKSNFFFQIGADTYNIFCDGTLEIIKELSRLGHCIGLHIDELFFGNDEGKICNTLEWFSRCVTEIDFAVSFHRPSEAVLHKKYNFFINTYQSDFFSTDGYFSDSRRNKEFYSEFLFRVKEGKTPIQLLLHPAWWYPEKDIAKFKAGIIKRRESELRRYLSRNFKKALGVDTDENRTFGL